MIILGAVLLVVAALFTLGIIFTNGSPATDLSVFGVSLSNVSLGGLFLAGLVTGAAAMLGLTLILGFGARKRHKNVQRKRDVKHVRGKAETLEQENTRLRDEIATGAPMTVADGEPGSPRP